MAFPVQKNQAIQGHLETHPVLKRLTRSVLAVPFAKLVARRTVRLAIQRLPLSKKNKERVYNLVAAQAVPSGPVTCWVPLPGCGGRLSIELDLNDDLSRIWYYWAYQHYEWNTILLWTRLLDKATIAFDVGANIGQYTLLAAACLRGRGTIHSFEPNPEVISSLARNVDLNRLSNACVVQLALSDCDGQASFFLPKNKAWTNGSLIEGFTDQLKPMAVDTIRFDTYCTKLDIGKVDLIKIDVEGAELKVLSGMGELLHRWKPDIICEVLGDYAAALNDFFDGTSYRKFLISSDGLQETSALRAHPEFRNYYLSCAPLMEHRPL
jgi:FkbM family methyltransferase